MTVGNLVAMSVSLAGAGAVLASSAAAFAALKLIGAVYLIGIGVLTLARARTGVAGAGEQRVVRPRAAFWTNVALGTFHPKTIVFFVAFAPQFISSSGSYLQQATLLIATFGLIVGSTDTLYALAASRLRGLLRSPRALLWSQRAGGGVLIAAGVATAAVRR
jgi:threonine/homoserine/homoserine lactone efflux protein